MTAHIRIARAEDLAAIRDLLVATWHDTYDALLGPLRVEEITSRWHSIEALGKGIGRDGRAFLVAEVKGEIAATSLAVGEDGGRLTIARLYVHPRHQGRGLGRRLLKASLDAFPAVRTVRLEVEPGNMRAIAFYERAGFRTIGEGSDCGGSGDGIRHLVMEKVMDDKATSIPLGHEAHFATNLANWNERARVHSRDEGGTYRIGMFKAGASVLNPIEAREIGDVAGKRLAHLQCHFGLDTLSLARLGADVTGLDFSPVALQAARELAAETGLAAHFVEGNVYEARSLLTGLFDVCYVTWGAINWLPDIGRWAQVVAGLLAPGGFLYLLEGHPTALVLDEIEGRLCPRYPWRTPADTPNEFVEAVSYTGQALQAEAQRCVEWMHPLGEIVTGLARAGLTIETLNEHEELAWQLYPMLVPTGEGMFRLPDGVPAFPLSFSLKAVKP